LALFPLADKYFARNSEPIKVFFPPCCDPSAGRVFDITPVLKSDPNHALTVTDIKNGENKHGRIPPGCFAALRTDMYKDWDKDSERFKRYSFPAWSFEAIQFPYEQRGIVANGHESMDTYTSEELASEKCVRTHGQVLGPRCRRQDP